MACHPGRVFLLALLLAPAAVLAQEPAPIETIPVEPLRAEEQAPAPLAEDDSGVTRLEDVVVTATKREKSLREIPASIASLSGEELEQRGAQGIEDIVRLVPGVNFTSDLGITRVTIRGIAAETGTNMTTGLAFGNTSFTDAYIPLVALDPNPFDLQSVEVLKGPQGTLFGAAALNGLVRYVPEPPKYGMWEARYFGQYTTLSQGGRGWVGGAAINIPIGDGDRYALRLMGFDRNAPGWIDNHQTGQADSNKLGQQGVRGIFGLKPLEDLELTLTYAWQATDIDDAVIADNPEGNLSNDNRPRASPQHSLYDLGSLSASYQFSWAQLVSETAFVGKRANSFTDQSRDAGGGAVPFLGVNAHTRSGSWSQELRLVSTDEGDSRWQWLGGVFWSRQHVVQNLNLPVGDASLPLNDTLALLDMFFPGLALGSVTNDEGRPVLLNEDPNVVVKELALFGEVTRYFGEKRQWELAGGGRLYRTSSGGTSTQSGPLVAAGDLSATHTIDDQVKEGGFSPKLSLLWHANDNILSYAAVSRGFRVGGIQPGVTLAVSATTAPDRFKSDTIWNYEGGLRTQWFGRTLHLDLGGFHERWKDPQTIQKDSSGLTNYIDNAGGVTSTGADLSLQWLLPIPGFMLGASGSYAKTVTTETFTTGSGRVSQPGDPWPFAPKWQTAATLAYATTLGDWQLNAGVTHSYMGTAYNNLAELLPLFNYRQWDATVHAGNLAWRWLPDVTLTVNNVTDERGVVTRVTQMDQTDYQYIQPRAVIVRLGGTFQ
jgi:iron complex outermembrane receptor protein